MHRLTSWRNPTSPSWEKSRPTKDPFLPCRRLPLSPLPSPSPPLTIITTRRLPSSKWTTDTSKPPEVHSTTWIPPGKRGDFGNRTLRPHPKDSLEHRALRFKKMCKFTIMIRMRRYWTVKTPTSCESVSNVYVCNYISYPFFMFRYIYANLFTFVSQG